MQCQTSNPGSSPPLTCNLTHQRTKLQTRMDDRKYKNNQLFLQDGNVAEERWEEERFYNEIIGKT